MTQVLDNHVGLLWFTRSDENRVLSLFYEVPDIPVTYIPGTIGDSSSYI